MNNILSRLASVQNAEIVDGVFMRSKTVFLVSLFLLLLISTAVAQTDNGQWNFDNDVAGNFPSAVSIIVMPVDAVVNVTTVNAVSLPNAIYFNDSNTTAVAQIRFTPIKYPITNGTISFNINFSNTEDFRIWTYDSTGTSSTHVGIYLRFLNNNISFNDSVNGYITVGNYYPNITNNVSITFDSVNRSFDLFLNGSLIGSKLSYSTNTAIDVNTLDLASSSPGTATAKVYLDDITFLSSDVLPNVQSSSNLTSFDSRWNFDNDVVGIVPNDTQYPIVKSDDTAMNVSTISAVSSPNSLYFNDSNASKILQINFIAAQPITNGTISFNINFSNTEDFRIFTYDSTGRSAADTAVSLRFLTNKIYYYNGASFVQIGNYYPNMTHNVSLSFLDGTKSYNFSFDGNTTNVTYSAITAININSIEFASSPASSVAKAYLDDLVFFNDDYPRQNNTLRRFPYPYKSAFTISSDIDSTNVSELYDIYDYLNTNKDIGNMGTGVDLEIASNFWMMDWSGDKQLEYYKNSNFSLLELDANASVHLDYVRTGYFDTLHNLASDNYNMTTNLSWYLDAMNILNQTGNVTAWINHGGNVMVTNVGTSPFVNGDDLNNLSTYHWNRTTTSQPIRYYWASDHLQQSFMSYPLIPTLLNDSSMSYKFVRTDGASDLPITPDSTTFERQINESNTQSMIRREGYNIIYTHLGTYPTSPIFNTSVRQDLKNLSNYSKTTNQTYITTLAKLLRYAEVSTYLNYTYNSSNGSLVIYSVNSSVRNFTPTVSDLEGITFYVPTNTSVFISSSNVTSSIVANPVDSTGQVSIMFPLLRLSYPYPNISSVGSYEINSSGSVLWNRTSTRPALAQKINATIIPSSDTVNFTVSVWNITGDYRKVWNESSTNASVTTQHIIGDLPAGRLIQLKRNGIVYGTYQSNSTGYITYTYTGGYSEHQFEIGLSPTPIINIQYDTLVNTCDSLSSTYMTTNIIFSLILMIAGLFLIIQQLKSDNVNIIIIISGIGTSITGFSLLIFGNYIINLFMYVVNCQ